MADHLLEPTQAGGGFLYPDPNPALAQILVSPQMGAIMTDATTQVLQIYVTSLEGRRHDGDRHPGAMAAAARAEIRIGGYKNDRLIGEVVVPVDYAASDEFGRKQPSQGQHGSVYQGSHALTTALYSVLPQRI